MKKYRCYVPSRGKRFKEDAYDREYIWLDEKKWRL